LEEVWIEEVIEKLVGDVTEGLVGGVIEELVGGVIEELVGDAGRVAGALLVAALHGEGHVLEEVKEEERGEERKERKNRHPNLLTRQKDPESRSRPHPVNPETSLRETSMTYSTVFYPSHLVHHNLLAFPPNDNTLYRSRFWMMEYTVQLAIRKVHVDRTLGVRRHPTHATREASSVPTIFCVSNRR
jgi:hypothetical protein